MSSQTLSVFHPQHFSNVLAGMIDRAVDIVVFGTCCHEEPIGTFNDNNSIACRSIATVRVGEFVYCERCARKAASL